MTLYNLYSGGVQNCSGTCKDGRGCRRQGYTINRQYGYWCHHHKGQEQ